MLLTLRQRLCWYACWLHWWLLLLWRRWWGLRVLGRMASCCMSCMAGCGVCCCSLVGRLCSMCCMIKGVLRTLCLADVWVGVVNWVRVEAHVPVLAHTQARDVQAIQQLLTL